MKDLAAISSKMIDYKEPHSQPLFGSWLWLWLWWQSWCCWCHFLINPGSTLIAKYSSRGHPALHEWDTALVCAVRKTSPEVHSLERQSLIGCYTSKSTIHKICSIRPMDWPQNPFSLDYLGRSTNWLENPKRIKAVHVIWTWFSCYF